ncbi:6-phosphogluconolactonase [Mucilaginibacter sp. UR6-11]|uniref:6-phosphogluconolactonase n=1 Tax=Mucilaginibacter sp. UR6-11 TaxID=1435644 RepID=UPI001E52A38B|nr:6-phosphogluconolactonase [Mucilaginibacter sp. UR6-11]MCC8426768.1 6-phosphogluconolactonase [Mucilaginibacter sp. UR6-11]
MNLNIFNTPDEVVDALAQYFVKTANESIAAGGKFSVALSGGSSPKKLYELLASTTYADSVDWTKVYFFFGDERNVPQNDPESNYLMAKKALFEPLYIDAANIFAVDTTLTPNEAAQKYAEQIAEFFDDDEMSFDLVLLGLGDDAHTASLFPHTEVLHDVTPSVKAPFLPAKQIYRITLNAPLINEAKNIAFLVYGESKAVAVHHVLEDEEDIENYPAQLIDSITGEVHWFLDEAAAADLEEQY